MRFVFLLILTGLTGICSFAQRECISFSYQQQLLKDNPTLASSFSQVEAFTLNKIHHKEPELTLYGSVNSNIPVITIPVVVHVLYHSEAQNISDAQILSQIEVLNKDFRKLNADAGKIPEVFRNYAADCYIEFKLATIDSKGRATNGIVRRKTGIQYFGIDDRIKSYKIGGDDPWNPDEYLNIWVGNLAGSILGYSSTLGGPKEKDGIVVRHSAFGTVGSAAAPFNLGRTTTHEVGHWLGLQHIWGDTYCGDDLVDDTPPQKNASTGCPSGTVISCTNSGNMYMNFMDFTNDACTNMFTVGQRERMRTSFEPGGSRHALLSSDGCTGIPVSIDESLESEIPIALTIYPNPVLQLLNIKMDNHSELMGEHINIYNHLGQVVKQLRIGKGMLQVDVSHLGKGMYFITVGEKKKVYKFVKQ